MIREEAMVIEWSSDPHPADTREMWDQTALNQEIQNLRNFIAGQLGWQGVKGFRWYPDIPHGKPVYVCTRLFKLGFRSWTSCEAYCVGLRRSRLPRYKLGSYVVTPGLVECQPLVRPARGLCLRQFSQQAELLQSLTLQAQRG